MVEVVVTIAEIAVVVTSVVLVVGLVSCRCSCNVMQLGCRLQLWLYSA